MKFKIKSSLLIVVAIILGSILATNIESSAKRSESMMEYMNNFFSNSERKSQNEVDKPKNKIPGDVPHQKNHKGKKKHKTFRFKERTHNQFTQVNSTATGTTPILGDWFMISSPAFKNSAQFPPVLLPSGTQIAIQTDSEYYRLNQAFSASPDSPPSNKFFWFRLSGLNIYYSLTKSDMNILGAIGVQKISSINSADSSISGGNQTYCFSVQDSDSNAWKICSLTQATTTLWMCQIKSLLSIPDSVCNALSADLLSNNGQGSNGQGNNSNTIIIQTNITQPIIIIPIPSPQCNDGWNYQQNGADWICDCSEGVEQAPIDLPTVAQAVESPVKPLFQYEEVASTSTISTIDGQMKSNEVLKLKLTDNSLKIFHNKFGKVVTMDGAVYYAQEIIVHSPAEHTIDGKIYDMELQIVHYGQSKGDIAKQLILSFVFEKTPGVYNKFIDDLDIFNLPNSISPDRDLTANIFIPKIFYSTDDNDAVIMKPFSFYTYQGSLTAPPCTESTIMYVASQPIQLGSTAIQLFQEALRVPDMMDQKGNVVTSNWIPRSNRKTQPRNGRPVFHYNHESYCGPDPVKKSSSAGAPKGHYEKTMKAMTNYFYVSSSEPSGIPNAFVVSEKDALGK